jgi:AraC family transcriptional regulator
MSVSDFYTSRINRVIDYIECNLSENLSLEKLAEFACFSKYHFHRIFKAVTNETLNIFIKRIKMETALRRLNYDPHVRIIDLAMDSGYQSHTNFTRDFKNYYQVSPSKAKNHNPVISVQGKTDKREEGKTETGDLSLSSIGIKNIQPMTVVYERILNGYDPNVIPQAFQDLYNKVQFYHPDGKYVKPVGIAYDDPDYTPLDKCRYDACYELAEDSPTFPGSDLNTKVIEEGLYACFALTGKGKDIFAAWDSIFEKWIVTGNFVPVEKPNIELYFPCPEYEKGFYNAHLCVPVRKII